MLVYVGFAVFGFLSVVSLVQGQYRAFLGWLVQIPAYTFATYGLYLKILYRSNDDFLKLNRNLIITSCLGLLTLPLVYFFQYSGLAVRAFSQNVSNIFVHARHVPYRVKAKFSMSGLRELAAVSLPLQIPVYLDSHLLKATVSLIILNFLGEESLGVYSMAILLQGFLLVFSRSLNQIFTTKLMLNFGKHDSLARSFDYIKLPVMIATFLALIIVLIFNYCASFAISFFLPRYTESIPVVQVLAFELVFALARSPFTLFVSALMYKEMVWLRVGKVIFALLSAWYFRESLVGIASAILLGEAVYLIGGYLVLTAKVRQNRQ